MKFCPNICGNVSLVEDMNSRAEVFLRRDRIEDQKRGGGKHFGGRAAGVASQACTGLERIYTHIICTYIYHRVNIPSPLIRWRRVEIPTACPRRVGTFCLIWKTPEDL